MQFYTSLFPNAKIVEITRYGAEGPGAEGSVMHATFAIDGQQFMALDSSVEQPFTFTPAMSLHVKCRTREDIDKLYARLSKGGEVFMPLDEYPFSKRFGWVADKYGVSWQLDLPA